MTQTAVEWLEDCFKRYGTLLKSDFIKAKEMENLFLLPTDKPSRFVTSKENKKCYLYSIEEFKDIDKFIEYDSKSWDSQNIYITSNEEIKEGDWFIPIDLIGYEETSDYDVPLQANIIQLPINIHFKKIILTTDKDLIKDGVQAIDDEFLEWFVKNPSCEEEMLKMLHKFGFDYTYNYKGEKTIYEWIPEWFEEYKRLLTI